MDFGDAAANDLIHAIYAAATDPGDGGDAWHQVLAAIQRVYESDTGVLQISDATLGRTSLVASAGLDLVNANLYEEYYFSRDLFVTRADKSAAWRLALSQDFVREGDVLESEIFNDFLQPRLGGLFYNAGVSGRISQSELLILGLQRNRRRGEFERDAARSLEIVWQHVLHAMRLRARMGKLRADRDVATEALDALQAGVLILREGGAVVFANAAALHLMDQKDGLWITREGRLALQVHSENVRLEAIVSQIVATQARPGVVGPPDGAMRVTRGSDKAPLSLLVAPFRPSEAGVTESQAPLVLLLISDPDERPASLGALAAKLYGLTVAEAALAEALAAGETPEEIAGRRAVRITTVRTQLQALFSKTGTTRQVDLMRLLLSLPRARRPLR